MCAAIFIFCKLFCFSEMANLKVLSVFLAQMQLIQLKFIWSAIDAIWDKLISFQPTRSEYLQ